MTKRKMTGIVKKIEMHKAAIAKHRDDLRHIQEELESVLESADEGLLSLEAAVDTLSQYV